MLERLLEAQSDLIKVELVELEAEYYHVTLLLIII